MFPFPFVTQQLSPFNRWFSSKRLCNKQQRRNTMTAIQYTRNTISDVAVRCSNFGTRVVFQILCIYPHACQRTGIVSSLPTKPSTSKGSRCMQWNETTIACRRNYRIEDRGDYKECVLGFSVVNVSSAASSRSILSDFLFFADRHSRSLPLGGLNVLLKSVLDSWKKVWIRWLVGNAAWIIVDIWWRYENYYVFY